MLTNKDALCMLWAAGYSACVVYTKTITGIHLSAGKVVDIYLHVGE